MLLFIADLHLSTARPEVGELFLRFLRERAPGSEGLYILGDLFEAWLGDDLVLPDYAPILSALKTLTAAGTPVFVQHGNRDFLLGEGFAAASGCTLLPEAHVMDLYGRRTLLLHGDTLCTDDHEYQAMRVQLRRPEFITAFLAKPAAERIAFARSLRERSQAETSRKSEYIMDVNAAAVADAARQHQAVRIIHGHTHRAGVHTHAVNSHEVERVVLGDWGAQGSVAVCDAAGCRLEAV
ncbi:MAG: UDP-2,3-diacylglucosamine diphosphatase [Thiohalomonadaceae bacterium]